MEENDNEQKTNNNNSGDSSAGSESDSSPDENIEAPKSEWIREGIEENDEKNDVLKD
jgi:hypothetical protein